MHVHAMVHASYRRGGQNKTAKSSIDAILKLPALPMSRAGVYQFSGESCPRSNRERLSIPRTGGEVGGPILTMAVVVVAGVSGGRRVVWQ